MSSVPVSVADAAASATISGTRTHRIVLFGATELLGMVLAGRPVRIEYRKTGGSRGGGDGGRSRGRGGFGARGARGGFGRGSF